MKKIIIISAFLILVSNIFGQVSYNQEFQVNTITEEWQWFPKAISLNNGRFVVSWYSDLTGDNGGIRAQLINGNGQEVGTEFQLTSYRNVYSRLPALSELANGGFVFCRSTNFQPGILGDIYGQIYNENGIKVGDEFRVNTNATYPAKISVAGLTNGGFVVTWSRVTHLNGPHEIFAQLFNANGLKVGNEFQVNSYSAGLQTGPSVCKLLSGGFVICWSSSEQDGSGWGIYSQIYDESADEIGEEFRVNTFTPGWQTFPKIKMLMDGRFIVTWHSKWQDDSESSIFAQIFNANGTKAGVEFKINTYSENKQEYPDVVGLLNGGFVVTWMSYGQEGNDWDVYAQVYDSNGVRIGNEFLVNNTVDNLQGYPTICTLQNRNFVMCWASDGQDGDRLGVFGKYYLETPIEHNIFGFNLLEPKLDSTLVELNPTLIWESASDVKVNFPWELTYELCIDKDMNFSNPIIYKGIHDTIFTVDSLTPGNTYFWKILSRNYYGDSLWSSDVFGFYIDPNTTDVKEKEAPLPEKFELSQNYPNPFNPTTRINFTIPVANALNASQPTFLKIYDILGNEITTLVDEQKTPGTYEVEFDGTGLVSGIYFYKLDVGKYSETKKMLLMK